MRRTYHMTHNEAGPRQRRISDRMFEQCTFEFVVLGLADIV